MSRVVLAGGTPDLIERLRAAQPELAVLPPGRVPTEPVRLFELLPAGDLPPVVVLGPAAPVADVLALAGALDVAWPGISVVLVGEPTPELWPAVMRAGIREVVPPDADVTVLREVVGRAAQVALGRRQALHPVAGQPSAPGRVIAVVSPKGGVGKTTVSTNLAVGLAAVAPQSTVIVDLDVQFGDVASALALQPEYTLPDAVHGRAGEDSMVLKTFLTQHPSGLYAVCGSDSPAAGDTVTADDVSRLLAALAHQFRYVVVDTAPGLSEQTLAALDVASDAVLLSSLDVPGVRGLRKEMDVLGELNLLPTGRHVVMNLADPKQGLDMADVELALGTGVDVVLPRSAAVPASTNAGEPLLLRDLKRDPATRELRRLLERFGVAPAPKSSAFWTRQKAAS
ncbi:AAA family ATPase [Blastococcus sp. HT6-30]|uniref:AAA family ATPase n=1 Tax=Blastococcus sp. HT6-30 TaxID=3144843 RepID=UPI00321B858D